MNPIAEAFIDGLVARNLHPEVSHEGVRCNGAELRILPDLGAETPDSFELEWPRNGDPASALFPAILCEAVLGTTGAYPAFTDRAAHALRQGGSHVEAIGGWELHAAHHQDNLVLTLRAAGKNAVAGIS